MGGKKHKDSLELIFDGSRVTATTSGASQIISVIGGLVSASDVDRVLVIRAGTNFIAGIYMIESVDTHSNTWTLGRPCTNGPGSNMTGELIWQEGRWHPHVPEYYDNNLPNNPSKGEARKKVLEALDVVQPNILRALADSCFKPELLKLEDVDHGWSGPLDDLFWAHLRDAGRIESSDGWVILGNLKPLRDALVRWVKDESRKVWNLCDNEGEPIDWIADAAIQTVIYWHRRGRLPKILRWEHVEFHCYRSLENDNDYRMFDLERQFDASSGFKRVSPGQGPGAPGIIPEGMRLARLTPLARGQEPGTIRLSDRAQRKAKQEYKALGEERGLTRMESVSPRYFEWYACQTFLGMKLREIREREMVTTRNGGTGIGIGNLDDPNDLSAISHGIDKVAALVDFRRKL